MDETLRDLYGHQAWADAEHWRAFEAHPSSLADPELIERLHHLHLVQRAFLALCQGQAPKLTKLQDFATPGQLKLDARRYHEQAAAFVAGLDAASQRQLVTIPWFKDPPLELSVERALTQAAFHSHGHRAQNAARLRVLGGKAPTTDLIVWYWKGQPAASWD